MFERNKQIVVVNLLLQKKFEKLLSLSKKKKYKTFFDGRDYNTNYSFVDRTATSQFVEFLLLKKEWDLILAVTNNFNNYKGQDFLIKTYITILNDSNFEFIKKFFENPNLISRLTIKSFIEITQKIGYKELLKSYIVKAKFKIEEFKDYDYELLKKYFELKFEISQTHFSLKHLKEIYSKTRTNTELVSKFINKNIILSFIESKTYFEFSNFLLTIVDEDTSFKLLTSFFSSNYGEHFEKILDVTETIDTDKTECFSLILDSLNCKSSETVVKMLEKSKLTQSKKEEILLLKAGKSCKI